MKNLILCFRHEAFINNRRCSTFCGLGDVIKSFVNVYLYCRDNNINFYLNFDGHTLKPFLNFKKFYFTNKEIKPPKDIPFVKGLDLNNFISSNPSSDIFFMTDGNGLSNFSYDNELMQDFEEVFLSNKKILAFIDENHPKISKVFHARLGDGKMASKDFLDDFYLRDFSHQYSGFDWYNSVDFDYLYPFIFKNFNEEIMSSDYICSDHLSFKSFLSKYKDFNYINSESVHLGLKHTNKKNITDTLCDFYILYKCESAVSISHYPFGERPSGFSYWVDKMFVKDFKHYSFDWLYRTIKPLNVI